MAEQYIPKVNAAKELSEISKDFTRPREFIANSIDASASKVWIDAQKVDDGGEQELLIRVTDNGVGMTKEELYNFFDLGFSRKRDRAQAIGEKGHGTKIAYNSTRLDVFTKSIDDDRIYQAWIDGPRKAMTVAMREGNNPPPISVQEVSHFPGWCLVDDDPSGTVIEVRGYDGNNWAAFAHGPLRDYLSWFTVWGRIDVAWGGKPNPPCRLLLRGLGESEFEELPYGHVFPEQCFDFRTLRTKDDRRPENHFVRRWVSEELPERGQPTHTIRIVFSVEGDSAKRDSNYMLK